MKTIRKTDKSIFEIFEIFRHFGWDNSTAIFCLYRLILLKQILDTNDTQSKERVFTIAPNISWNELRRSSEVALAHLIRETTAIEKENPILDGIFSSCDFQAGLNKDRANNLLGQLILILTDYDFSDFEVVKKIDGFLCQELSKQSKTGYVVTPESISKLVVKLLAPQEEMSICDPFCGVGSFLTECASQSTESSSKDLSFYGQEIDRELAIITRIRLLLHGVSNFNIQYGDTIQEPKLLECGKLKSFDLVMSVFPWGKQDFRQDILTSDPHHRFRYGIPPKNAAEFIYIQHILATLDDRGKAAVVMPHGVLFRGGAEGKIRENIIKADLLEAVIVLPANLFDNTSISTAILVFNRNKSEKHQDKVLFIDASNSYSKNRSQYYISDEEIDRIAKTHQSFAEGEGYAKLVSLDELADNDYLLNINRYVFLPKKNINLRGEFAKLHKLEAEARQTDRDFQQRLDSYLIKIDQNEYFDAVSEISSRSPLQYPYGLFFSDHPMCGGDSGFIFQWFESFAEMKEHFINFELLKNCLLGFETDEQEKIVSKVRERFDNLLDNPQDWQEETPNLVRHVPLLPWQLGIEKLNQALSEWFEIRWCGTFEQLLKEKGEFETEVRKHYLTNYEDMMEKRTVKDREIPENEVEDFEGFLMDYGL